MRSDPRPDRRPDLDTASIIDAYKAGASANSLARLHRTSVWSIINRLQKAGIRVRSSKEQVEKRLNIREEQVREFTGLLDGLLLGDASITRYGYLSLPQTDARRGWLEHTAEQLAVFDVQSKIVSKKLPGRVQYIDGHRVNAKESSVLYTPCYVELMTQRARWYPNGAKRVPEDVVMTALGLAYWFCGDGTGNKNGSLCFCTNSFSEREVRALAEILSVEFDVAASYSKVCRPPVQRVRKPEFKVNVFKRDDAQRFKDLTEAYMPKCCLYKFRHVRSAIPRGSVGAKLSYELAERIRDEYSAGGVSQSLIASRYGVTQMAISAVVRGVIYSAPLPSSAGSAQ